MPKSNDWVPSTRVEILAMCRNWNVYMTEARRTAWGVPADQFARLGDLWDEARTLLSRTKDPRERTCVITGLCKEAFVVLKDKMRFFRDRYFKMPPLTEGDWIALGFRLPRSRALQTSPPQGAPVVAL
ncbi:MAG: hypothetical protein LBG42_06030, partial [Treponema sp.]|nr:hypothetical protein [Treponema sp.]